jgi:ferritin-like metal-binding protein YciE
MGDISSLRAHLVDELIDLLDAEKQLAKALPKLARTATSSALRRAFDKHLNETRRHVTRLTEALRHLGEAQKSRTCEGMQGLLQESHHMVRNAPDGAIRDAVMITGAQKVEHYEMASYGTARTYARVLGEKAVARLLEQTLREEKAADRALTRIAEASVNRVAADSWQAHHHSTLTHAAEWVGWTAGYATSQVKKGMQLAASAVGVAQDKSASAPRARPKRQARNASVKRSIGGKKR